MRGDFSRSTFRESSRYSSVLMQQGRVLLDADFNEQAAILLHYLRTLAADMIGPNEPGTLFRHGGPGDSFKMGEDDGELYVGPGRYYVDGILCENGGRTYFANQAQWPQPGETTLTTGEYLVYLDVWERLITPLEDDYIREVALGGADTCARAQVIWQIKLLGFEARAGGRGAAARARRAAADAPPDSLPAALEYLSRQHNSTGMMAAGLKSAENDPDPCIMPPESRYRGQENQLYRVEIHTGGTADLATFKWSRDNGSVTFPVLSYSVGDATTTFTLGHLGRDYRFTLEPGDWVEVLDDSYVLREQPGPLLCVASVNRDENLVTVDGVVTDDAIQPVRNALLRRWDHHYPSNDVQRAADNAFKLNADQWLELEHDIVVRFAAADEETREARVYHTGDYWLIPARTITGLIEWPGIARSASPNQRIEGQTLPPQGVQHHYAPLAAIQVEAGGSVSRVSEVYKGKDANGNEVEFPLRRSLASIPLMQ